MSTLTHCSKHIIVALDGMSRAEAFGLAEKLRGRVWGFKANDLIVKLGVAAIRELKTFGNVFADPKLHDIPNTVANSIRECANSGADLVTIHSSGGRKMIAEAAKNRGAAKVLAVTVLTSMSDADAKEIYQRSAQEAVLHLAKLAIEAGADGIVCSPKELEFLHDERSLANRLKVTPGVRPSWYQKADDQSRTLSPVEAIQLGATHLVIGRPITGHENPLEAIELIENELKG